MTKKKIIISAVILSVISCCTSHFIRIPKRAAALRGGSFFVDFLDGGVDVRSL